jgi:hypothetical protein
MNNLASTAADLSPASIETLRQNIGDGWSWQFERIRIRGKSAKDIATPPNRWDHWGSFFEDGGQFDIWVNWDGRVKIECEHRVVLQMWAPAGEIFKSMDFRDKARKASK